MNDAEQPKRARPLELVLLAGTIVFVVAMAALFFLIGERPLDCRCADGSERTRIVSPVSSEKRVCAELCRDVGGGTPLPPTQ